MTAQKEVLQKLKDQYYGKKKYATQCLALANAGAPVEIQNTKPTDKITRAELMRMAQSRGIKNFRILNKAELEEVLYGPDQTGTRISGIIAEAVARWKAGWGKRGAK